MGERLSLIHYDRPLPMGGGWLIEGLDLHIVDNEGMLFMRLWSDAGERVLITLDKEHLSFFEGSWEDYTKDGQKMRKEENGERILNFPINKKDRE